MARWKTIRRVSLTNQNHKLTFSREYVDDKKSGYGVFIWSDSRKYRGNWLKGR